MPNPTPLPGTTCRTALTVWTRSAARASPPRASTTGLYDTGQAGGVRQVRHVPARQQRPEPGGGRRRPGEILVIKDSYANSFVPYLTANYAAIDVVDFRNYNYGLDQLIAANDYDQLPRAVQLSPASRATRTSTVQRRGGLSLGILAVLFTQTSEVLFHATFPGFLMVSVTKPIARNPA